MTMEAHLKRFCAQPRTAGGAHSRKIRDVIKRRLLQLGYEVKLERHPFVGWELLDPPRARFLSPVRRSVRCLPVVHSGSTDGKTLKGRIEPAFGTMKTFEAYAYQRYMVVDDENELIAVLMTRPDTFSAQPLDEPGDHLPHIIVDPQACAHINRWIADGVTMRVAFSISCRPLKRRWITNVIAQKPEGTSGLLLSAHYDSFFTTVGAHDNASGAVVLLELAARLAERAVIKPTLCFFDAEEWNKYGSYCYVDKRLAEGTLGAVRLQINLDSVGAPDQLYMLLNPETRSAVTRALKALPGSRELGVEVASRREIPQFDVWPFLRQGVNVVQIGSRSAPPFAYWHSPRDDLGGIDCGFMARVADFVEAFALTMDQTSLVQGDS